MRGSEDERGAVGWTKHTLLLFHRAIRLIVIESSILSPRLEFQSTTVNL